MPSLMDLSNELLLQILKHVATSERWINDYHPAFPYNTVDESFSEASQDLRNIALVCRTLRPLAREQLFRAPYFHGRLATPEPDPHNQPQASIAVRGPDDQGTLVRVQILPVALAPIDTVVQLPPGERCLPYHARPQLFLRTLSANRDLVSKPTHVRIRIQAGDNLRFCPHKHRCINDRVLADCIDLVRNAYWIDDQRKKFWIMDLQNRSWLALVGVIMMVLPNVRHITMDMVGDHMDLRPELMLGQPPNPRLYRKYYTAPLPDPRLSGARHLRDLFTLRYGSEYNPVLLGREPHLILNSLRYPQWSHVKSVRLEADAPYLNVLNVYGLVFYNIPKLDLLLRPSKDPHALMRPRPGLPIPVAPLRNVTHLRLDCRIQHLDYKAGSFLWALGLLIPHFTNVQHIECYAEPALYDHMLDYGPENLGDYRKFQDYEDSLNTASWHWLVHCLRPLYAQLKTLTLPGGFWSLPRRCGLQAVEFYHLEVLETLAVPKGALLGIPSQPREESWADFPGCDVWHGPARPASYPMLRPGDLLPYSLRELRIWDVDREVFEWLAELIIATGRGLLQVSRVELEFSREIEEDKAESDFRDVEDMMRGSGVTVVRTR